MQDLSTSFPGFYGRQQASIRTKRSENADFPRFPFFWTCSTPGSQRNLRSRLPRDIALGNVVVAIMGVRA